MANGANVQINTQKIPVGSGIGAAVLIVVVLTGMFLDLPGVRGTGMGGGAIGLVLAVVLIQWRRRTMTSNVRPTLGITGR